MKKTKNKAQNLLQKCCDYWQKRLNLSQWHIQVMFAPWSHFPENVTGSNNFHLDTLEATIRILDPVDYKKGWYADKPQNIERTIVHELLHLHFAPVDGGKKRSIPVEQAIDSLSRAFVP